MTRNLVWSYGGGVQTIAILTLVAEDKLPVPELAVFADTGRERTTTFDYLHEHAMPLMDTLGINFVIAGHDLSYVDLYGHNGDLLMPVYTKNGKLPTLCSNEWKQYVVRRCLRSMGYGVRKPVTCWLGMSMDEVHRMRVNNIKWCENDYPLALKLRMSRVDCLTQIERFGLPIPEKSTCWGCPHMNDDEWLRVKEHPVDWPKAVALDKQLRADDKQGGVWLHSSRVPLDQAEFKGKMDLPLFECADSCWT